MYCFLYLIALKYRIFAIFTIFIELRAFRVFTAPTIALDFWEGFKYTAAVTSLHT